jgi:hypothetical protein
MIDTLRGLLPRSLEVIKEELQGDNPLPAAIQVLKICGLYGAVGRPTGPTTPEAAAQEGLRREVERAQTTLTAEDVQLAQRQRQQDRTYAELAVL